MRQEHLQLDNSQLNYNRRGHVPVNIHRKYYSVQNHQTKVNRKTIRKNRRKMQSLIFDYCLRDGDVDRNLNRLQSFQQADSNNVATLTVPVTKVLKQVQKPSLRNQSVIKRRLKNNRPNMYIKGFITNKRFKKHVLKPKSQCPECNSESNGFGVPIFDKLRNPDYRGITKFIWIFFLVFFLFCTSYLTYGSFHEFFSGKPTIVVDFKEINDIAETTALACPHNPFAVNNPAFRDLRLKYKEMFPGEGDEIFFSDLIRIPGVDVELLWGHQEINMEISSQCSVSKRDNECTKRKHCYKVNTVGGLCHLCRSGGTIPVFGSLTSITGKMSKPKRLENVVGAIDFYAKGFQLSEGEKAELISPETGFPAPLVVHGIFIGEFIEIINLNTTTYPCEDAITVHKCVEKCIDKLMSNMPCRLPFMTNSTRKMCDSPLALNQSIMISTEAVNKNFECRKKCPRKCYEKLLVKNAQFLKAPVDGLYVTFRIFNLKMPVIREFSLYTLNNLVADIGGTFGFFLGFCCLTFLEIIEYVIKNCRMNEILKIYSIFSQNKKRKILKLKTDPLKINIGIAGVHRLSSNNPRSVSKYIWRSSLFICTCICIYQIGKTFQEFMFGNPDSKLIIERNESVLYPAVTVCPFKPFTNWQFFQILEETYRMDFNISENETVYISDLINHSDTSILEFWNQSSMDISVEFGNTETYFKQQILIFVSCMNYNQDLYSLKNTPVIEECKTFSKIEYDDGYTISYRNVKTVNGLCVTITINPLVIFRDMATIFCYKFENLPEVLSPYSYTAYFHNELDDPRTFDPKLGIPMKQSHGGIWSVHVRKRELMNRRKFPCEDEASVSQCRSQCYDDLLESKVSCRLPFMRSDSHLKICHDSISFNNTLSEAYSLISNHSEDMWCNCPSKCKEYIYGVNRDELQIMAGLRMILFAVQFPNNIFLVTQEYWKMNLNSLYTDICGFLGLYLGFTAVTALELIEALFIIIHRKFCNK